MNALMDHATNSRFPAQNYLNRELGLLAFNRRVLAQAQDERVPLLERLRFLGGLPAVYSTNWMPLAVGRTLIGKPVLKGTQSLNATLREAGYRIYHARREVAAVLPPVDAARYLQLSKNVPALQIKSMSRDISGMPFDYYESYARSDVVTISVDAQAVGDVEAGQKGL